MSRKIRIVTRPSSEVAEEYEEEVNVQPVRRTTRPTNIQRPVVASRPAGNEMITFHEDEKLFSSQDLIQMGIPLLNQCVFYLETLRMNGIGVVVDNVERAQLFEQSYDLSILQEESPRQAHYLQVIAQRTASENRMMYWMINAPIIPISTENPLLGKIQYYLATRENRYLAIIVLSE
jgi:hypothetical protein